MASTAEVARPISPGFSTADAVSISFSLKERTGVLEFTDWQEKRVRVGLVDAVALKWQEADSSCPEDRDDMSYEIVNSEWLKAHIVQKFVKQGAGHKHYKFCFNAAGNFEVICSGIRVAKT